MMNYEIFKEVVKEKFMDYMPETVSYTHLDVYKRQVAYSPQNVVSLATAKCQAGGMITTQQNLQNHLNDGSITQEEYNEYYPYDGMELSLIHIYTDYHGMMDLTENMYRTVAQKVLGTTTLHFGDLEIDLSGPFLLHKLWNDQTEQYEQDQKLSLIHICAIFIPLFGLLIPSFFNVFTGSMISCCFSGYVPWIPV